MNKTKTPFYENIQQCHKTQGADAVVPDIACTSGWFSINNIKNNIFIVFNTGQTGGYRSFIAFNKSTNKGVVILINSSDNESINELGFQLLTSKN